MEFSLKLGLAYGIQMRLECKVLAVCQQPVVERERYRIVVIILLFGGVAPTIE